MKKSVRILAFVVILSLAVLSFCACHKGEEKPEGEQTSWYIDSKVKDAAASNAGKTADGETTVDTSVTPAGAVSENGQNSSNAAEEQSSKDSDKASETGTGSSKNSDNNTDVTSKTEDSSDTKKGSETSDSKASESTKAGEGTGDKTDKQHDEADTGSKTASGDDAAGDTAVEDTTADASDPENADASEQGTEAPEDSEGDATDRTAEEDASAEQENADTSSEGTSDGTDTEAADASETEEPEIPEPDQAELRQKAWNTTLLVWIPEFTEGTFVGISAAETYDYAVFEEVTDKKSVDKYVQGLITAGFDDDPETGSTSQSTWFMAGNAQGWQVSVEYNKHTGILKIGSGYNDGYGTDNDDQLNKIWSTTSLSILPISEEGILESYLGGQDSYAVLSSFSKQYAAEYVEAVKLSGFIFDVDEGESDGVMWYIAEDTDGNCAAFVYSEGVAKIMCSKAEY